MPSSSKRMANPHMFSLTDGFGCRIKDSVEEMDTILVDSTLTSVIPYNTQWINKTPSQPCNHCPHFLCSAFEFDILSGFQTIWKKFKSQLYKQVQKWIHTAHYNRDTYLHVYIKVVMGTNYHTNQQSHAPTQMHLYTNRDSDTQSTARNLRHLSCFVRIKHNKES